MLVKILGLIDISASIAFLILIFGLPPFTPFFMGIGVLLIVKGLFILTGDFLSILDLFSGTLLLLSLLFSLPALLLWIPSFFLLAKGIVSFV